MTFKLSTASNIVVTLTRDNLDTLRLKLIQKDSDPSLVMQSGDGMHVLKVTVVER